MWRYICIPQTQNVCAGLGCSDDGGSLDKIRDGNGHPEEADRDGEGLDRPPTKAGRGFGHREHVLDLKITLYTVPVGGYGEERHEHARCEGDPSPVQRGGREDSAVDLRPRPRRVKEPLLPGEGE